VTNEEEIKKDLLEKVDVKKRDFLKKLVISSVFAVPVIASFSMDGIRLKAAYGQSGGT
jgi:hypothetical protein